MESFEWHDAYAALDWQVELGADEAIQDTPIDRYGLAAKVAPPLVVAKGAASKAPPVMHAALEGPDGVAVAEAAAKSAPDLEALRAAMEAYPHCELKGGARSLVFSDGRVGADVMIVGGTPSKEDDREGRPFGATVGQLLDRMLGAIDMTRAQDVYLTTVVPWRPPQDRDPRPEEIAMMAPFLKRHIALAAPRVVICMGDAACTALLGQSGIKRLRGTWTEAGGLPVLPMLHPAHLLRQTRAKRDAWADLLALKAYLKAPAKDRQ